MLYLLVDVVHIYLVLTFGCHRSLNIAFSRGGVQIDHPKGLTHTHVANYHNAPILPKINCNYGQVGHTFRYHKLWAPIDSC